ncbi:MAG: imidazoleglycerol-phosphate dehydratase HisB [Rectinema sp.]|nr:imidazoleglycerol-phosphate dehydratase HisB [Rectinema sp.]
MNSNEYCTIRRTTKETDIELALGLEPGNIEIHTGIGFLDHMLTQLAFHAGWSLTLTCQGDIDVDDHHSVEDCAIALGQAFARLVPSGEGRMRFGSAFAPMDEALARAVVDISGRGNCLIQASFEDSRIGTMSSANIMHFFKSFSANAGITIHLDLIRGENDHHRAESLFKAAALALRAALLPRETAISSSTKGKTTIKSHTECLNE